MTIELTHLIIVGLAGAVSTLAGIIYYGQRRRIQILERENGHYRVALLSVAAKKDETIAQIASLLEGRSEDANEAEEENS